MSGNRDRKIGVVKVSLLLIEEAIFRGQCVVEQVIQDSDDLMRNTVSVKVSGNESLPFVAEGELIPQVDCQITRQYDTVKFVKL